MSKFFLFLLVFCLLAACGKNGPQGVINFLPKVSSKIKSNVKKDPISATTKSFIVPLTGIESYKSGIHDIGFLFGGVARIFADIGTKLLRLGDLNYTLKQRIPELPVELMEYIKIKRVFFYIEPVEHEKRYYNWFEELILGKDDVTFKFLDKLAIKMKSTHVEDDHAWEPIPTEKKFAKDEKSRWWNKFFKWDGKDDFLFDRYVEASSEEETLLLAYDNKESKKYLQGDDVGPIYVVKIKEEKGVKVDPYERLQKLSAARVYFNTHPKLRTLMKRTMVLENMLILELDSDPVILDSFRLFLNEPETRKEINDLQLNPTLCSDDFCRDFKIPNTNLVKLVGNDNGLDLDAIILVTSPPNSFNIRGFIEFEIKLKEEKDWD